LELEKTEVRMVCIHRSKALKTEFCIG
jgi:hypothetical protein